MMQRIKTFIQSKYVYNYGANLLLLIVFWGGLIHNHFTSDTLTHAFIEDADIGINIAQGRYLRALGDWILLQFGVRTTDMIPLTMGISILLYALTMTMIQYYFRRWEPEDTWGKFGYNLMLNLWILNVLYVEILLFTEMSLVFALAYLGSALVIGLYHKKQYVRMVILMLLTTCLYQYGVIFTALLLVVYIQLEEREITWKVVQREFVAIGTCLLIGFLNLLSTYLLMQIGVIGETFKDAGAGNLSEKIAGLLKSLFELNQTALNIFPKLWVPLLFSIGLLIIIAVNGGFKVKWKFGIYTMVVWLGGTALLYVIPIAQKRFSFPPRMAFTFFMLQGLIAVLTYQFLDNVMWKQFFTILCVGYVTIHLFFSQAIISNHYISNALDEVYTKLVYAEIVAYEEETGLEVTKLCMFRDADSQSSYDEVSYVSNQINEKSTGLISVSLMEYVTGRSFEKVYLEDTQFNQESFFYKEHFQDKDWKYFDAKEQIVIEGDTAYWCVF